VAAVRATSGAAKVSVLGYCLGALLSLIAVARNPDVPIHNLVLLATPVDLQKMSLMAALMDIGRLEPRNLLDETPSRTSGAVNAGEPVTTPVLVTNPPEICALPKSVNAGSP
jgi:pimeloyl-ACP methyl ester carboxylesterase